MPAHRDPDQFVEQVTAYAETYGIHLTPEQRDALRALAIRNPGWDPLGRRRQPAPPLDVIGPQGHTITRIVLDETITWPGTEG